MIGRRLKIPNAGALERSRGFAIAQRFPEISISLHSSLSLSWVLFLSHCEAGWALCEPRNAHIKLRGQFEAVRMVLIFSTAPMGNI